MRGHSHPLPVEANGGDHEGDHFRASIARATAARYQEFSAKTPVVARRAVAVSDCSPASCGSMRCRPTRASAPESDASPRTRAPSPSAYIGTLPDTPAGPDVGPTCTSRHGHCCAPVRARVGLAHTRCRACRPRIGRCRQSARVDCNEFSFVSMVSFEPRARQRTRMKRLRDTRRTPATHRV
jgi:hypothetical protein